MKFYLSRTRTPHSLLISLFAVGMMLSGASSYSYVITYGSSIGFTESSGELQVTAVSGPLPAPTATLLKQIPATLVPPGTNGVIINLTQYFTVPPAPSNTVLVSSSVGSFCIQLFPTNAPSTVANFLDYVNDSAYENMLVHLNVPGAIIQTGGFSLNESSPTGNYFPPIETFPAITNEFGIAGFSNIRGTVAMALVGTNPNSATSQWFINVTNNSSLYDATNSASNAPSTVFGQVIGNGMSVVDAIAALPTDDLSSFNSGLSNVPLNNWDTNPSDANFTNLVIITNILTLPYLATSSDPNSFAPEFQGTNLVIKYIAPKNTPPLTSPESLTVYASDTNGNTVQSTFQISERKLYQNINFTPPNKITYNGATATKYALTNLPTASSGLPVTITIGGGPAKDFRILTNQIVTMTTNQLVSTNVYYTTNTSTNNIAFTNSITIYTTNSVTNSLTNSFTNSTITLTGAGNVALVAHQSGNAIYYPAQNEVGYVTVYKALQTITFPQIANQNNVQIPAPILPWNPPTASSELPVSVVVKSGPAKANKGANTSSVPFDLIGSGTVTLVATQNGNVGYYAARPVTNSFVVTAINEILSTSKGTKK